MATLLKHLLFLFCIVFMHSINAKTILRIPLNSTSISLDPRHMQDISSLLVSRQISCQLIRNHGGIYTLEAAKSIKYISPLKILVELNSNRKFTDGSPLTAKDVVASFNYIKNSRDVLRNIFTWIDSVTALNDKKILFTLKKPIPQFLTVLSMPNYAIHKKEFLERVNKNNSLWKNPIGCGGYKITETNSQLVYLTPTEQGLPIKFFLDSNNQISSTEMGQYDIVNLTVVGNSSELNKFSILQLFDPSQIYIGLNATLSPWENKVSRCIFLARLNEADLLKSYDSAAKHSNDFIPQGTLGYDIAASYFEKNKKKYSPFSPPKVKQFCLAYLIGSVPKKYRVEYLNMLKNLYPNVRMEPITVAKQFGLQFRKKRCDAIIFSLKSNYLDAYEYLDIFDNNDANFSNIRDKNLIRQITNSQNISNPQQRANKYRKIIKNIENLCFIKPLLTIPLRTIYIRRTLKTPDIGLGPLT